jgi:hypothetical protein
MPFSTLKTDWRTLREELEQYLPPPTKAWQLCQNYFDNAAWLFVGFALIALEDD